MPLGDCCGAFRVRGDVVQRHAVCAASFDECDERDLVREGRLRRGSHDLVVSGGGRHDAVPVRDGRVGGGAHEQCGVRQRFGRSWQSVQVSPSHHGPDAGHGVQLYGHAVGRGRVLEHVPHGAGCGFVRSLHLLQRQRDAAGIHGRVRDVGRIGHRDRFEHGLGRDESADNSSGRRDEVLRGPDGRLCLEHRADGRAAARPLRDRGRPGGAGRQTAELGRVLAAQCGYVQ